MIYLIAVLCGVVLAAFAIQGQLALQELRAGRWLNVALCLTQMLLVWYVKLPTV